MAPAPAAVNASIESAAKAAIAAAIEDVTIRPLAPKPSLFIDPAAGEPEAPRPEVPEPAAFIPPQPERLPRVRRACRGSTNCRCRRRTKFAPGAARLRRTTIPKSGACRCCSDWLRSVSAAATRTNESEPAGRARERPLSGPVSPERLTGRPMPRPSEPRQIGKDTARLPVSEYARRSAPQGLDQHGRQAPVHNSSDEDQLDIPAFLRRQAN